MISVQKGERAGVVARAFAKSAWRWSADEWNSGNTRTALGQTGHGCCMGKERQGKKGPRLHRGPFTAGDLKKAIKLDGWEPVKSGDHLNYKHPSRRARSRSTTSGLR